MREKTKAGIKAALWILIAMPAMWFVLTSMIRLVGFNHPMPFSNFIVLMVVFGVLAIFNVAGME